MTDVAVLGGTGFIGREVVRELLSAGKSVRIVTRQVDRARASAGDVELREGDVRRPDGLTAAYSGCSTVIHCVQFPNHPFENPRKGYTYMKIDGEGTAGSVLAAKQAGAKRFVYVSGAGVDGPSLETWFQAKRLAEKAVRESGMEFTIVRPSWICGEHDRSLNKFVLFAKFLPFIPMIGPCDRQKVSPVFVKDVARVLALCVDNPRVVNQTFELGGPEVLTMNEIVQTMLEVLGKRRILIPHPVAFMKVVAFFLQVLPTPPLTPRGIDFVCMDGVVDLKPFYKLFPDFRLTPLKEALRSYL
ncbi:NAD(P)H-binding protein [bacterium]|nr:NAD(P)H-binding protein [bacterium]